MTAIPPDAVEARSFRDWMLAARHERLGVATAVGATAVCLVLRLAMSPLLEDRLGFLFFIPAIIGAAAFGGAGSGVLATVLGLPAGATPLASRVHRVSGGLPQYAPGHLDRVSALEGELISAFPRLVLAGAAYRGTSVPLCIRQGRDAADKLLHRVAGTAGVRV